MLTSEYRRHLDERLARAGVESPGLCARVLLCHCLDKSREQFIFIENEDLPYSAWNACELMADRLCKGEPLAYVLGKKEFYKSEFIVDAHVLIPRPETELLVETALKLLPVGPILFLDAGTGSGCIGLSLLVERPQWSGLLLDNIPQVLDIARKNSRHLAVNPDFICGDIFKLPFGDSTFDLILANPPYIAHEESPLVMRCVLDHEPYNALFSSNSGLAHLFAMADQASHLLKPGGWLILEHGCSQASAITLRLEARGFSSIQTLRDLAGLDRCTIAKK